MGFYDHEFYVYLQIFDHVRDDGMGHDNLGKSVHDWCEDVLMNYRLYDSIC